MSRSKYIQTPSAGISKGSINHDLKQPEVISEDSSDHEPQTTSRWRRIVGYVWDSAEGTLRNRKYVQKSMLICWYFIKYLDQTNVSNAFVSGMKEDLRLYGNERNWLNTWFSLGVMIGSLPAMLFQLSWARPSYLIPTCEVCWSVLVMCMAATNNIKVMYTLRFFIGLFEACAWPGYIALLGGWYGPKELTKRVAILLEIESIASMFSGYLQAGIYKSLNGRHGLPGWKWLFIMDGVISIPIAVWGYFGIPDLPHTTKAFYLSADDRQYGIERIEKVGRQPPVILTKKVMKDVFLDWKIWSFVFPYVMLAACNTATSYFNLWLKAVGYHVYHVNTLPTAGNALAIVVTLIWGILND
ncbi:related to transporter protein [Rhynchosporium graminicola]|uniref:Related to transporter protein n=1 Tax=Rhynchosporium graminicola TaxID=2792576 RepID=A0A1E1LIG6_9HELO|nr:related to transporter protein [Rhynchosporium commune]